VQLSVICKFFVLLFVWHVISYTMQNYVNYSLLVESVKALLGKHVKILLKNVVKLETKQDKQENRVLVSNFRFLSVSLHFIGSFAIQSVFFLLKVFSPCRLFLLSAKVPTRVSCIYLFLFLIRGIEVIFKSYFLFFLDRLPFSLFRNNSYRVKKSQPIMFDRWRTILQFYHNQHRCGYYRSRCYDRGLTYGDSKYFSYSTIKVCFIHLLLY